MSSRTWILAALMTTGCAVGVADKQPAPGPIEPLTCMMDSGAPDYVYSDDRLAADDNIHGLAAALDGTLYFVTGGDYPGHPSAIARIAPNEPDPESILFDADLPLPVGDTLYFRCSGTELCSSDLSGASVSTVAGDFVTDLHGPLLADDHAVYGLDGRSLVRVPLDGSAPTTLAAKVWVQDLDATPWGAVADGYVYFVDGETHTLSRVPSSGGARQTIVQTPITALSGIAVRGSTLVYNTERLYELTLGKSGPTPVPFVYGGQELVGSPVLADPKSGAIYMTTMEGVLRIDASFSSCAGLEDEWIDTGSSGQLAVGRGGVFYTSVDRTAIDFMTP